MIELALSLGFVALVIAGAAYAAFTQKSFPGFSNTARRKAWNGELSGKTIKEMEESIANDAKSKTAGKHKV